MAEWQKLGVKRADGGKFGSPNADAFVMVPQGVNGPRFLVTQNFLAIMDYNLSHSYALAVGHLADRIRGKGAFVAPWPDVDFDLSFEQRVELQKRLNALGFETGGSDGRFGARTYEAIIAYQKKSGLPLDGVPSREAAAAHPEEQLMSRCRRHRRRPPAAGASRPGADGRHAGDGLVRGEQHGGPAGCPRTKAP